MLEIAPRMLNSRPEAVTVPRNAIMPAALLSGLDGLELAGVVRQPGLDVRVLLQSLFHQLPDLRLRLGALHGGDESRPSRADLIVRRQRGTIDQLLDIGNRLLVEFCDAAR